jgi:transposase
MQEKSIKRNRVKMYIAITKKKYKDTYHQQILLRESYREDGKVKTRTLLNLTNKPKEQVEAMAAALKIKNKDEIITAKQQFQGKTIGFTSVIIFIMNFFGIIKVIGKKFEAKIALVLIAAAIVSRSSRLQALFWAKDEDKILDLLKFNQDEKDKLNTKTIYLGLDYIYENQQKIEDKLFKIYYGDNPPKKVFYDVTSSYVEGDYSDSELVKYGYNRDGKKGKQQIVIGLLTDENGHAISIHTYPGNTNDVKTFADQLHKLKNRFKLENITIVGDGGMIKSDDIIKIKELGYDYITSIGKPSIRALIKNQKSKVEMTLFDEDLKEVIDKENNKRYILRLNPIRRDEIRKNMEEKIESLKKFINTRIEYYNTHFKAKKETLEKDIDKKISNLKLSSFISCNLSYKDGDIIIVDKDKKETTKTKKLATTNIAIDEAEKNIFQELDGCYIIKTSLMDATKDSKEDIHKAYKTLIKVENAFKTLKTDYLEIRPLYLKTDKRIIGHVALSMIAYNIVLKLKEYINLVNLDFKSTIAKLSKVQTINNKINDMISFETIPEVCDNLKILFSQMKFKLSTRI